LNSIGQTEKLNTSFGNTVQHNNLSQEQPQQQLLNFQRASSKTISKERRKKLLQALKNFENPN